MKGVTGLFILCLAHLASCSVFRTRIFPIRNRPPRGWRSWSPEFPDYDGFKFMHSARGPSNSFSHNRAIRKTTTKTTPPLPTTTTESPPPPPTTTTESPPPPPTTTTESPPPPPQTTTTESPPDKSKGEELTLAPSYIDRIDKLEEKVERLTRFIESQEKENSRDKQKQSITDTKLKQLEAQTLGLSTMRVELESACDEKIQPLELEIGDLRQGVVQLSRRLSDLDAMFEDQGGEISKIRQDMQHLREAEETCTQTTLTLKKNMFQALAKLRHASTETAQDVAALTDHIQAIQERVEIIGNRTMDVGEGEGTLDNYVGGITIAENDDGENVLIPEISNLVDDKELTAESPSRPRDDTEISGTKGDDDNRGNVEQQFDSNMFASP